MRVLYFAEHGLGDTETDSGVYLDTDRAEDQAQIHEFAKKGVEGVMPMLLYKVNEDGSIEAVRG
ncbi:hypothetical protein [uncultured Nostoc sp.]|uniref:hypothetical protein n=1 Tax=uncultured Nostoc sp. TaxID=340711 RepID=UPI0035C9BDE7